MTILITGKNGAGKTTLAKELMKHLDAAHFEADKVRELFNDWRFDYDGRWLQAERMKGLASLGEYVHEFVILDFICPTNEFRERIDADFVIWMCDDGNGKHPDTLKVWEDPDTYHLKLTKDYEVEDVVRRIKANRPDVG